MNISGTTLFKTFGKFWLLTPPPGRRRRSTETLLCVQRSPKQNITTMLFSIYFKSTKSPPLRGMLLFVLSWKQQGFGETQQRRVEEKEWEVNHLYEPWAEKKNKSVVPWRGDKWAPLLMLRWWPSWADQRQPCRTALLRRPRGRCYRRQAQERARWAGPQMKSQSSVCCWRRCRCWSQN